MSDLSKEMVVWQANALVEASQSMTLNEKRLIYAAAALHDPRKPPPPKGTVTFHADKFADMFGLDLRGKGRYDDLKDAAKRLYNRTIRTIRAAPRGQGRQVITDMRWVWMAEYNEGAATVTLGFSPPVLPYLTMLNGEFTRFKLRHIGNIGSYYGLRMYELCCQYRKAGQRTIPLAKLREMLDLNDKYESVKDLRRWVLTPAMKEINKHTDLRVVMTPERKGRKVVGFHFDITRVAQIPLDMPTPNESARPPEA